MLTNRVANEVYFRLNSVELLIDFQKKKKKIFYVDFCLSRNLAFGKPKIRRGFIKTPDSNISAIPTSTISLPLLKCRCWRFLQDFNLYDENCSLEIPRLAESKFYCNSRKVQKIPVPNFKTYRFKISRTQKFYTFAL